VPLPALSTPALHQRLWDTDLGPPELNQEGTQVVDVHEAGASVGNEFVQNYRYTIM
jgi:hypothetical protein